MPNDNFIKNVLGWLQRTLFEFKWLERPSNELLPFQDGVLEVENNKWHEHSPGFRMTWVLPHKYKGSAVNAGWSKIENWLNQATKGDKHMKDILLAFCAATLRGKAELQKCLLGTGYGGTGKGTLTQLITMVVGEENVWVGKLEDLTKQDKVAELQTKRLAIFDDQEKYTGNLSNFRSMTGGALISGRNLYERSVTFRFPGLVLITANQPCFPASALSWLKRRIIQQEFAYTPTKRNRNLVREFEPEISAFTKYLLSIPVSEIEQILDPEDQSINSTFWEDRVRADPMAAWLNELVIHDADAKTAVGADKNEWKDKTYIPTSSTLFGSYSHYCTGGGYSAKGKNNFSADLVELCREVLGWKDVSKERAAAGAVIKGLRLRTDTDKGIVTVEETLEQKNVDLSLHSADLSVDLEPLPHKDCVDHVDLTSELAEKNENTSANSNLIVDAGTDSTSSDQVNTTADAVEVSPPPTVYTVYTSHTEQGIQPSQGLHSGLHSGQHFELNEDERDLVEMIRVATAELDTEIARRAAADILPILKDVCARGAANREKVWAALTESERTTFSALSAPPLALTDNPQEPESLQPAPEPEIIAPADAEKLREIATVWWPEYYPQQLQTLITQMFGWGAPGTRYGVATITAWLASEDAVVRERIGELIRRRSEGCC
jgi:putative DNA primase/helicase